MCTGDAGPEQSLVLLINALLDSPIMPHNCDCDVTQPKMAAFNDSPFSTIQISIKMRGFRWRGGGGRGPPLPENHKSYRFL